jgi:hypothetical protein
LNTASYPDRLENILIVQPSNNYLIYGLKICTNQPLQGLLSVQTLANADINIQLLGQQQKKVPFLGKLDWRTYPNSSQQKGVNIWQAQGDDGTYSWLEFLPKSQPIDFIINHDGSRVWVFWSEEKQYSTVVSLLLGSVLGRVLLLRGVLCLHASVVSIDGKAIALLGQSCAGKSTTAMALAQRGFPVLADDIAALSPDGTKFWVQPGYPRLRLSKKAVNAFGFSVEELPKVTIYAEKRYLDLSINSDNLWQFQNTPLPLSAIYLLEKRDSTLVRPKIVSISQAEALGKLAANVYGKTMLDKQRLGNNFQQLSQLVQVVPIRQLARPDDLGSLSLICDVIIDDFKQLIS